MAVSSGEMEEAVKKVLLTSSSKAFLGRNKNLLVDKGFQLFAAATGIEALQLHQKHLFDLVLSDLELEDMDGCRLCSEVRKTESSLSVPVVLICYDTAECMEKVKQSDATAILLKPINPTQLLVTIGSFIDMQLARSKRVACNAELLCTQQGLEFSCVSHDISVTGILLETEHKLSPGDQICCQFKLLDSSQANIEGVVTRCIISSQGKMLYGVKFIDIPSPNRSVIEKYVVLNNHLGIRLSLNLNQSRPVSGYI
jgi:DNA-binding response OmpR family regulator